MEGSVERYRRPTARDFLDSAERYASDAVKHLFWVCNMLGRAGEGELAEEAMELRDKARALSARVSARYHEETTDGE